jgi:hypothetical protein
MTQSHAPSTGRECEVALGFKSIPKKPLTTPASTEVGHAQRLDGDLGRRKKVCGEMWNRGSIEQKDAKITRNQIRNPNIEIRSKLGIPNSEICKPRRGREKLNRRGRKESQRKRAEFIRLSDPQHSAVQSKIEQVYEIFVNPQRDKRYNAVLNHSRRSGLQRNGNVNRRTQGTRRNGQQKSRILCWLCELLFEPSSCSPLFSRTLRFIPAAKRHLMT